MGIVVNDDGNNAYIGIKKKKKKTYKCPWLLLPKMMSTQNVSQCISVYWCSVVGGCPCLSQGHVNTSHVSADKWLTFRTPPLWNTEILYALKSWEVRSVCIYKYICLYEFVKNRFDHPPLRASPQQQSGYTSPKIKSLSHQDKCLPQHPQT